MKEDIVKIKKEVKQLEDERLAMEILKGYKSLNKKQFIIILVLIEVLTLALTYIAYLLVFI